MNLPEKLLTYRDAEKSFMHRPTITATFQYRRTILRLAVPLVTAAALLSISTGPRLLAQTADDQASSADEPALDPGAMDALNRMGAYMRTLKTFQVKAEVTTDEVTNDGETIQTDRRVDLLAARPDRMRVEINGDDEHRFYLYDGKNFTVFGQRVNYYATVPAPPTTDQLISVLNDKYGIELPLVDLFYWGTDEATVNRVLAAKDIGPSTVEGITCEHYAFHQKEIDWQVWIQLGDFPLPQKLVIRTLSDDARPQHSETLSWNLAPSFNADAFIFQPPNGAQPIQLDQVNSGSADDAPADAAK
jgi:hypothetical protein